MKQEKKSFEDLFGGAQEFVPNPMDCSEKEFEGLDEEDAGGEDELADMDCTGIEASVDEETEMPESEECIDDEDEDEDEVEDDDDFMN